MSILLYDNFLNMEKKNFSPDFCSLVAHCPGFFMSVLSDYRFGAPHLVFAECYDLVSGCHCHGSHQRRIHPLLAKPCE